MLCQLHLFSRHIVHLLAIVHLHVFATTGAISAIGAATVTQGETHISSKLYHNKPQTSPPPFDLHVNGESVSQLAATSPITLGWAAPPSSGPQVAFKIRLEPEGKEYSCHNISATIDCSRSDNVDLEALIGRRLAPATTYAFSVQTTAVQSRANFSKWSKPFYFATALPIYDGVGEQDSSSGSSGDGDGGRDSEHNNQNWFGSAVPVWGARSTQKFVILRASGFEVRPNREYLLHITAHAVPMRKKMSGANASKLLGAYALWVNGVPVATGPGRPTGINSTIQDPAQLYDTLNITRLLRPGESNVLAVQGFYWNNEQEYTELPVYTEVIEGDQNDAGGIMVLLRSGSEVVTATGVRQQQQHWLSYDDADSALLPAVPPPGCQACCNRHNPDNNENKPPKKQSCEFCKVTGGRFQLMHERWNMSALPAGWRLPTFNLAQENSTGRGNRGASTNTNAVAGRWSPPSIRQMPFTRLAPKGARAIQLLPHQPVRIAAVTPSGTGSFECQRQPSRSEEINDVCGSLDSWKDNSRARYQIRNHIDTTSAPPTEKSYCYIVDMGTIVQGGINITFSNASAGHVVHVAASELLIGMNNLRSRTGAVEANGTDESLHYDEWILREGRQTVVSHEYIVARFWQVQNSPEPPSASTIAGWKVWYPLDASASRDDDVGSNSGDTTLAKHGSATTTTNFAIRDQAQTFIETSSPDLDTVWKLCRNTGRIGMMDVNTDSNARQRDNCNVDSHITAMHQAAASQAASAPYRRRNAAFLFQPDSKVHPWTEFKLFSLGAVHEYALDTGDMSVANATFDNLVEHYSLGQFIQQHNDGLVHKAPIEGLPPGTPTQAADNAKYYFQVYQDLIDYPDEPDVFNNNTAFPAGARCCKDNYVMDYSVSTVINAHVAHAHRRLADMSRWLGHNSTLAARFDDLADGIVAGLRAKLNTNQCEPAAPACFLDGLTGNSSGASAAAPVPITHTAVQSTLFVVGCGLLPPTEALKYVPFLRAKTAVMPLFSAMASNFMLEGLYRAAMADLTGDAADLAFDILTRRGHRSWLEMVSQNATMTTEHWFGTFTNTRGAHTWSHPWSASPARIIPQWLMGVRPLDPAWRRIAVYPQPGSRLTNATMIVPTHRGPVSISLQRKCPNSTTSTAPMDTTNNSDPFSCFALKIYIPGNTHAHVCLPLALLPDGTKHITIGGDLIESEIPGCCPGQLCLSNDLPGGSYDIGTSH